MSRRYGGRCSPRGEEHTCDEPAETLQKIGQGVIKAAAALQQQPAAAADLIKLPPSKPSFGWLDMLRNSDPSFAAGSGPDRSAMFALS